MRSAIMQPYFLPYLGYFQLIAAVDEFVIYDTVQYTKKGWINRNRFLRNGEPVSFMLPLKKASDYLDVVDREISDAFQPAKFCAQIAGAYRKASEFSTTMPLIETIAHNPNRNLFDFIHSALVETCRHLEIETRIRIASEVEGGRSSLSHAARVVDICQRLASDVYVNPPGGRELYKADEFATADITLKFLNPKLSSYSQFGGDFVPGLSILDVMMFNSKDVIRDQMLKNYSLDD